VALRSGMPVKKIMNSSSQALIETIRQRPVKGFGAFAFFAIVLLHFVQVIRQVPSSIQPVAVQWLSSEL
jgi:hypothetical protein